MLKTIVNKIIRKFKKNELVKELEDYQKYEKKAKKELGRDLIKYGRMIRNGK